MAPWGDFLSAIGKLGGCWVDFVEDVDDLVDVVGERGVEDDDGDMDSVFLANLPCPA